MPSLLELQRDFCAAMLDPSANAAAPLVRSHGVSPARRLDIYRVSIRENYRKALTAMFPVVAQLVGPGYFSMLTVEYVRRTASQSGDIGNCGAAFADFLQVDPVSKQLPYLEDIARLEWAVEVVFHAADSKSLSLQQLAALAPDEMSRLQLHLAPRCQLVHSQFPVHRIWEINQPGADLDLGVDLNEGGVDLLVMRHNDPYRVEIRPLGASDFHMLCLLACDISLAEALGTVIESHPSFHLAQFLQTYVPPGVLYDFAIGAGNGKSFAQARRSPLCALQ